MNERSTRGGLAVAVRRLVRFILFLAKIFQRPSYRIISVGGPGNRLPHGLPCIPKVGWPSVEGFVDDPRSLGQNPGLGAQQVGEPKPERGLAHPFKDLALEQDWLFCGVAEVSAERRRHQPSMEVRDRRMVTAREDLGSRHGLLAVCRNALNRLKGNRGIEDAAEVVHQKLVRANLEDFSRIAGEDQKLPVAEHRLPSSQTERQGCEDGMLVAAPSRVSATRLQNAAIVRDEASQHIDSGSLVHVSISANVKGHAPAAWGEDRSTEKP